MASIKKDARSGNWVIHFRFGGTRFCRSCQTTETQQARRIKAIVEETINLLKTGRLVMPNCPTDVGTWILSGGKLNQQPRLVSQPLVTLEDVCEGYLKDQVDKADTTIQGEGVHIGHLTKRLGKQVRLDSLTLPTMQAYARARQAEKSRLGGNVASETVRKELVTFNQIWDWARCRGIVQRPSPVRDPDHPRKWAVVLPKPAGEHKFMTWAEIEQRIARGGLSPEQVKELWSFLFLDEQQVQELVQFVKENCRHPFIYPMVAFVAYTGARRSEMCRSLIDDIRLDDKLVVIREKKRKKSQSSSTRVVPLNAALRGVMSDWLLGHPGGRFAFAPPAKAPRRKPYDHSGQMQGWEAHHNLHRTLADSKWKVVAARLDIPMEQLFQVGVVECIGDYGDDSRRLDVRRPGPAILARQIAPLHEL